MDKKGFRSPMAVPCLLLAAALVRPGTAARAAADPPRAWGEFFDRTIPAELESMHIAGAAVSVVENGAMVFSGGYGFADVAGGIPVRPAETLFRIGSISKLFTWTAVMQLAERGALDLDADVNRYLDFPIPATYPRPITLRDLLTHSAGFEDRVFGYLALTPGDVPPLGQWAATHVPARVRPPGEVSSYSNYGAALAAYIVERVSGIPFDEYVEGNIFEPLGMNRTTLRQPLPADLAAGLSQGFAYAGGKFSPLDFESFAPFPTGGGSSTAEDMARFMLAFQPDGRPGGARILEPATAARMQTRLFGNDPRLNGWAYGFYELNRNGLRIIGHGGDTRLFHSLLILVPDLQIGVFAVYNTETAFDVQTFLLGGLADFLQPTTPQTPARATLPPAELARYTGSYRMSRRFAQTTVEKAGGLLEPVIVSQTADGALRVSSAWYGNIRLVPTGPLTFVQEDDPQNLVVFRTDSSGAVTGALVDADPTMELVKLPWYGDYTLHYLILLVSAGLFLAVPVFSAVRWIVRKARKDAAPDPRPARIGRWIFRLLAAAGLLFPIGFVLGFGGISYGITTLLDIALAIPLLFAALTAAAFVFLIRAWRKGYLAFAERIFYSIVVSVSIAYFGSLSFWNLIGWRY